MTEPLTGMRISTRMGLIWYLSGCRFRENKEAFHFWNVRVIALVIYPFTPDVKLL